ncbi:MAG: hypothetical protein KQH63_01475 [Desulfobulbaceae bacterium]|nr:hypothetical protein [Desulfobulbaceae bacterium]
MLEFFYTNETIILWSAAVSICTFFGSLLLVPYLVVQIPSNYFLQNRRPRASWTAHYPIIRLILLVFKNLLGYALLFIGLLMLVLPGQGLLTIVIAVMLMDFPGKYRFERWLATRRPVLRSINWLRKRAERDPLIF